MIKDFINEMSVIHSLQLRVYADSGGDGFMIVANNDN